MWSERRARKNKITIVLNEFIHLVNKLFCITVFVETVDQNSFKMYTYIVSIGPTCTV